MGPSTAGIRLLGVTTVAIVAWASGCSSVLGLQDWSDPSAVGGSTTTSTTTSDTTTTKTTSSGGLNVTDAGATCADGMKNGLETDVDCGGDSCWPCGAGKSCTNDADCASGNCAADGCSTGLCCQDHPSDAGPPDSPDPTCADHVKNGLETDVDCGGDACPPCLAGKSCNNDADCKGGHCAASGCL